MCDVAPKLLSRIVIRFPLGDLVTTILSLWHHGIGRQHKLSNSHASSSTRRTLFSGYRFLVKKMLLSQRCTELGGIFFSYARLEDLFHGKRNGGPSITIKQL